jgi:limonene-1,2-epoxide hydrolase
MRLAGACSGERETLRQPLCLRDRVAERKVVHWRDYLDPVAVFEAVGWPKAASP